MIRAAQGDDLAGLPVLRRKQERRLIRFATAGDEKDFWSPEIGESSMSFSASFTWFSIR